MIISVVLPILKTSRPFDLGWLNCNSDRKQGHFQHPATTFSRCLKRMTHRNRKMQGKRTLNNLWVSKISLLRGFVLSFSKSKEATRMASEKGHVISCYTIVVLDRAFTKGQRARQGGALFFFICFLLFLCFLWPLIVNVGLAGLFCCLSHFGVRMRNLPVVEVASFQIFFLLIFLVGLVDRHETWGFDLI